MSKEIEKIWIFRIVHYRNLEHILQHGIYCRHSGLVNPAYVNIGSDEIVARREHVRVKCFPGTMVSEYVPFYFGVRTPMLYKIKTGYGVPAVGQEDIVYLCCSMDAIIKSSLDWCFTDGNAAANITAFYKDTAEIDKVDWKSVYSNEWSDNNSDGDHDRMRKKHSEFLVKNHVPQEYISAIVVFNDDRQKLAEALIHKYGLAIKVYTDPQFYF
jgi:hypothetical protein